MSTQIGQEDLSKMQQIRAAIDNLTMQIGMMEFKKTKLVANLNEFQIASEKFVSEIIEKYGLPKDKKIFIDEQGLVKIDGEETAPLLMQQTNSFLK